MAAVTEGSVRTHSVPRPAFGGAMLMLLGAPRGAPGRQPELDGASRPQQYAFGTSDANFFGVDFDALGERAQVVAAVAARLGPCAPADLPGKRLEGLRC